MITKNFIEIVHFNFDELNYRETTVPDPINFRIQTCWTIAHCKELSDAIDAANFYRFCYTNWNKIIRMFKKKSYVYNQYSYSGNRVLSLISDKDSLGTYYVTNALNIDPNALCVITANPDCEYNIPIQFEGKKFSIFNDGDYYLAFSNFSTVKMTLFDRNKNKQFETDINEYGKLFLINNVSPYAIVHYDNFIGIYNRDYLNSLQHNEEIDINNLVADIEWDIIYDDSQYSVAKLNVYQSNEDIELLLFLSSTTFLTFNRHISKMQKEIKKAKRQQMATVYWSTYMNRRK